MAKTLLSTSAALTTAPILYGGYALADATKLYFGGRFEDTGAACTILPLKNGYGATDSTIYD